MYQVITIGSALVDVFVHAPSFETKSSGGKQLICQLAGEKVELDSFQVASGGGGSNTAVGLRRLGFKTALIAETGRDDFFEIVKLDLRRENVATELLILEKKEQTGGSVILVDGDGKRTVLVHRGAAAMLDPHDVSAFHLAQSGWIHLSSIGGKLETLAKIFRIVSQNHETRLSWNPGRKELELIRSGKLSLDAIRGDVLFVNREEWQLIADQQSAMVKIFNQVVVTNGRDNGQVWIGGQLAWEYEPILTKAVDETGAGDAFCSGYVAGQLLHQTAQVSVKWGATNAASVVKFFGAKKGLLDRSAITNSRPTSGNIVV